MSLQVPFDYNPVQTFERSGTANYTVPAGKYAIIEVSMNAYAAMELTGSGHTANELNGNITCSSESKTLTLRLESGSVLDSIENGAAGSSASSTAGAVTSYRGTSACSVTVDTVTVAYLRAHCVGWMHSISTASRTLTATGDADVVWSVAEYNNVT